MPPSERELLAHIARSSRDLTLRGATLVTGPGDDCAVVRLGNDTLLLTVDQLVEGRHYDPGTPPELVAHKALGRSVSDIAAMAGEPIWATATALLRDSEDRAVELIDAMRRIAEGWGCPLIGGDIAIGTGPRVLTVTAVGRCDGPPILRSGAKPGDGVFVSGRIGGSLASGRHLRFEPRLNAGRAARAARATALIDLSDGLGIDADRVGEASGVRLEIDAATVPLHPDAGDWRSAFATGEDYELLACGPAEIPGFVRIGRVVEGPPGAVVRTADGFHAAGAFGWDHGGGA